MIHQVQKTCDSRVKHLSAATEELSKFEDELKKFNVWSDATDKELDRQVDAVQESDNIRRVAELHKVRLMFENFEDKLPGPGHVAQSVTCPVTDASLIADPVVASSIPARSHTFVTIDHEIISTVILLPSAGSLKKGCCQLQAKVCMHEVLVNPLFKLAQEKRVVR